CAKCATEDLKSSTRKGCAGSTPTPAPINTGNYSTKETRSTIHDHFGVTVGVTIIAQILGPNCSNRLLYQMEAG
ncbi:hypothetical protein ACFL39_02435, partial [Gemmatimonadota bacterium]